MFAVQRGVIWGVGEGWEVSVGAGRGSAGADQIHLSRGPAASERASVRDAVPTCMEQQAL